MEVTIQNITDVQREAEFVLNEAELQTHFEKAYKKYAPKVELRGFRKGKVPLAMIKKMYGEAIEHDSLEDIANTSFRTVMEERSIEPIGRPTMVEMDFKRGNQFKFKIKYEIKPDFAISKYKGLTVEKRIHTVGEKEIQWEVDRIRRTNASLLGVTLVRDDGDHVITGDVQELADDGMPLVGKKTKGARFSTSDESLAPEIRDVLKTAEVGGEYRVRFESKHDDHVHKHHIAISVHKIEKVELPEFDDTFVKKVTKDKVGTKEEFLANLRKDLESYWSEQSSRQVQDTIISEIVRSHEFEVPESLVNLYIESYLEEIKGRSKDKQLPQGFNLEKFYETNREYATFQAKWALLREKIVEKENLKVTDQELSELAEKEAPMLGIDKEQLLKYYASSGGASDRLLTEKLSKFLVENTTLTEKMVDDATPA